MYTDMSWWVYVFKAIDAEYEGIIKLLVNLSTHFDTNGPHGGDV